jgi:dephospho-CoA kinase
MRSPITSSNSSPDDRIAIFLCGQSGAGKTTAADALRTISFEVISAGGLVKQLAKLPEPTSNRASLLSFGAQFIEPPGSREFGKHLLDAAGVARRVVFDGIRPLDTISYLSESFIKRLLIYIEINEAMRRRRLRDRGESINVIAAIEASQMERQLMSVRQQADLIIDNSSISKKIFEGDIVKYIDNWAQ